MNRCRFTGLRPRLRRLTFLLLVLVSLACAEGGLRTLAAQTTSSWTLDGVLGMMDKSAQDFHTLTADIEHIKYTAVVKDTSAETGHIFVRRDEKMRIEILKPDSRTILRTGDSLFVYNPKINRVEEFDLGKNRSMVDQYVLLGFGTKSENIKKSYLVSVVGEEELDHKKTVVLELTPKSDQIQTRSATRSSRFRCGLMKLPGCRFSRNFLRPARATIFCFITSTPSRT